MLFIFTPSADIDGTLHFIIKDNNFSPYFYDGDISYNSGVVSEYEWNGEMSPPPMPPLPENHQDKNTVQPGEYIIELRYVYEDEKKFESIYSTVNVLEIKPKEVWFTDFTNSSAVRLIDHYFDLNGNNIKDSSENYGENTISGPEWVSTNGLIKSKRALFQSGDRFKIKGVFTILGLHSSNIKISVYANSSINGFELNDSTNSVDLVNQANSNEWEGIFQIVNPQNEIQATQLEWNWQFNIADTSFVKSSITNHTIFICKNTSQNTNVHYDFVAHWACKWASNLSNDESILDSFNELPRRKRRGIFEKT